MGKWVGRWMEGFKEAFMSFCGVNPNLPHTHSLSATPSQTPCTAF